MHHPDLHTAPIDVFGQSIQLPKVPGRDKTGDHHVPALGEHTEQVRAWLADP